jgi:imidazolonepropionase-like amidohydrolase
MYFILAAALSLTLICTSCSQQSTSPESDETDRRSVSELPDPLTGPIAFVGVDVISMKDEIIQANRSVLIQDGIIKTIGKAADVELPSEATIIKPAAGEQWFLMPGLADMHTHESVSSSTSDEQNNFLLYITSGITTIFNMGDFSRNAPLTKQAVLSGRLIGPMMYNGHWARGVTDRGATFTIADTPEQGRLLVREAKLAGYEFIKLYNGIKTDVFDSIIDEARTERMGVVGHGVREPGMKYILENGMSMVAHAEEFIYTSFKNRINTSQIPSVTDLVARNNIFVTTTLSAYESIAEFFLAAANGSNAADVYFAHEGADLLAASTRSVWNSNYNTSYSVGSANLYPRLSFQQTFLKAFNQAKIKLLLGTDAPVIPGVVPGFALLRELELYVEAGISSFEALRAGTANPGEFISQHMAGEVPFGLLEEGYRADLILLRQKSINRHSQCEISRRGNDSREVVLGKLDQRSN